MCAQGRLSVYQERMRELETQLAGMMARGDADPEPRHARRRASLEPPGMDTAKADAKCVSAAKPAVGAVARRPSLTAADRSPDINSFFAAPNTSFDDTNSGGSPEGIPYPCDTGNLSPMPMGKDIEFDTSESFPLDSNPNPGRPLPRKPRTSSAPNQRAGPAPEKPLLQCFQRLPWNPDSKVEDAGIDVPRRRSGSNIAQRSVTAQALRKNEEEHRSSQTRMFSSGYFSDGRASSTSSTAPHLMSSARDTAAAKPKRKPMGK